MSSDFLNDSIADDFSLCFIKIGYFSALKV